jgi:amino-acid N-acetyltransferase
MTVSMSVCGKAGALGNLKTPALSSVIKKYYSTFSTKPLPPNYFKHGQHHDSRAEQQREQRELFVNVLDANATKRDAKQYLARFQSEKKQAKEQTKLKAELQRGAQSPGLSDNVKRAGVNLGSLYTPSRAIAETPLFVQQQDLANNQQNDVPQQLHVALVCLKSPEDIDDQTMEGLAITLAQLVKLDMRLIIVLDSSADQIQPGDESESSGVWIGSNVRAFRKLLYAQALRLSAAIGRHSPDEGRFVPGALEFRVDGAASTSTSEADARVAIPELLLDPLKRGLIPILPPLAYTESGRLSRISSTNVMKALTQKLISTNEVDSQDHSLAPNGILLDRIIVLDAIGGIPSRTRGDGAHVFINLEQEFDAIEQELTDYVMIARDHAKPEMRRKSYVYEQHRTNLEMTQQCLSQLPSSSSAMIITPQEAASSARRPSDQDDPMPMGSAGTRRRKNSLIHNLLTNKPMVSSSLPVARLPHEAKPEGGMPQPEVVLASTLIKRGMPLTIIPSPDPAQGWQRPDPPNFTTSLDLETDPRVDLPRLVHLIEDSFRRKLDVQAYLNRIRGRIAGLIVAGNYEGCAILTWETPPSAAVPPSPRNATDNQIGTPPITSVSDPSRLVPYLDKFAVLQSSQGSSNVADILFQSMVRSCFPTGVCWRSRGNNPVNKWYFERCAGSWKLPRPPPAGGGSEWTAFWTGEDVVQDTQRWRDYVEVCASIQPSWATPVKA